MNKTMKNSNPAAKLPDFQLRSNASPGLWVAFILPVAIIAGAIKHPLESSHLYKLCSVFALSLLWSALILVGYYMRTRKIIHPITPYLLPALATSLIYYLFYAKGIPWSCYSSFASTLVFHKLYLFAVKHFPRSFTIGEAVIITQAFLLYLFSTAICILEAINKTPETPNKISTLIIQVGLFAVGLLCFLPYKYQSLRKAKPFYLLTVAVIVFVLLVPLHVLLKRSPLLWILSMLLSDIATLKIVIYWCFCCGIAMLAVYEQIREARKASSAIRKTFHVLAVAVFVPGLMYCCNLLYLASGIVFGIFVALELLRILNLPPLGIFLQDGFFVFSDEKDVGAIAFTPLYLLAGCSLPLWIHPAPCDLTDSARFNLLPLLSGILSVGIGDTAASCVGNWIGKHRWTGTKKTIEGTLAYILSQAVMIYMLMQFGFISPYQTGIGKLIVSIIITSLVEAHTNQVDNLVLPLIMYIILI